MTDWVFWLLAVVVPFASTVLGSVVMWVYLRGRVEQWRAQDYDDGYRDGWNKCRLQFGIMMPEKTLLTSTVAAESLTVDARRERLAVLMDEAVEVVRADFDAIRAWVECQDLEASPPVPEWERPELAHTGPDPRD